MYRIDSFRWSAPHVFVVLNGLISLQINLKGWCLPCLLQTAENYDDIQDNKIEPHIKWKTLDNKISYSSCSPWRSIRISEDLQGQKSVPRIGEHVLRAGENTPSSSIYLQPYLLPVILTTPRRHHRRQGYYSMILAASILAHLPDVANK